MFNLAYWDIFKNYYANKQEENAYVITGVDHIWKTIYIGDGYTWAKTWRANSAETYAVTPTTEKPQYIKLEFKEKYGIPYLIEKVNYTRSFDGKNVKISQYKLVR